MRSGKRLGIDYLTPRELAEHRVGGWQDVLGVAVFTTDAGSADMGDAPVARVGTRPLGAQAAVCEVWRAPGTMRTGTAGLVQYRTNGYVAFGCVRLQESGGAPVQGMNTALAQATERAYAEIFACLPRMGVPHVLRIWNYLPEINLETGGVERYRQFNEARQNAFRSFDREVKGQVPAACALGSEPGTPLVVYFIAASEVGLAIENPRQVSAYDYPPQYGAFSPTFARATLLTTSTPPVLFVSGTSSIVGHRTAHPGDVLGQTRESVTNVRTVIEQANTAAGAELFTTEQMRFKVYLRRPGDLDAVSGELNALLRPALPLLVLRADICRADLLVEIEAVGTAAPRGSH